MLLLSIYTLLTTCTIASTYYVSSSPEADYKCLDDADGTCTIHCDQAATYDTQLETSFDCGHNKECYFYCDERKCAKNVHIIATNSSNLHVIVGINGEECMSGAVIDTPKSGNATFDMGNSIKGLAGMTVNAGSNAQNIIITAESTNIAGDDCKGMQIYTSTAEYVQISLGSGIKWENGILQCPAITDRYNAAKNITPCMLYASNAILMNTHIIANYGIPTNVWISPGVIYIGINTLTCDGATSIAPFDMNSECWFTSDRQSTFYPFPTIQLTANAADTTISGTDSFDQQTSTRSIASSPYQDFFSSYIIETTTLVIFAVLLLLCCCCSVLLCYCIRRAHRARKLHNQLFGKANVAPTVTIATKNKPILIEIPSKSMATPRSPTILSGNSNNSNSGHGTYLPSPSSKRSKSKPSVLPVSNVASYPDTQLSEWHKYQQQHMANRHNSWHFRTQTMQPFYTHFYNNTQSMPAMHPFNAHYNSQSFNNVHMHRHNIPPPPPPPPSPQPQPRPDLPKPPSPPLSASGSGWSQSMSGISTEPEPEPEPEVKALERDEKNQAKPVQEAEETNVSGICEEEEKEFEEDVYEAVQLPDIDAAVCNEEWLPYSED